jgi:predicted nucleic acid-binding protein
VNRKSSPKPRFATHRAKAVPIAKELVLQVFMRLGRMLKARQKGLVDHNDPAVFSYLKRKSCHDGISEMMAMLRRRCGLGRQ